MGRRPAEMRVTIVHDDPIFEPSWADRFYEFLGDRNVQVLRVGTDDPRAVASITDTHGLMWRFTHSPQSQGIAKPILSSIELGLQLPVWPNFATRWHYDDKIAQFYLLHAMRAPIPETFAFYDKERALGWAESTSYPVVFKLSGGASSQSVCLVESRDAAGRLIERAFSRGLSASHDLDEIAQGRLQPPWLRLRALLSDLSKEAAHSLHLGPSHLYEPRVSMRWPIEFGRVLFQEFLPKNAFDYRITVIGARAFGFRRFNRPNDFRASGSGLIDFDPRQIDLEAVRIAQDISARGRFQSMAFDLLRAPDAKLRIVEISYTFVGTAVQQCPGYWDDRLNWHDGHVWPQDAIAEDFLSALTFQTAASR